LGIPFYTRLWKETVDESGKKKLTSSALTMKQAKNLIIENNAR